MNRNILQQIVGFILHYTWAFCLVLIVLECGSTIFAANILMRQTAQDVMQSVAGEISGRVDGVMRLLTGLSHDDRFVDSRRSLYERALLARPYRNSYELFMIALTDKDIYVASTNQQTPPSSHYSLAHRDYMQRLYATGTPQVTDAFPAGTDGVTMNYTIAVPIIKDGKTEGSIFGAIYFEDIKHIIDRSSLEGSRRFYLLGSKNTFLAGGPKDLYGKAFLEASQKIHYFGKSREEIDRAMQNGSPLSFWEWGSDGLRYVMLMQVPPTQWTLLYQVSFTSVLKSLLPILIIKCSFYFLLCAAIAIFGRRYLNNQLGAVSHLLDKVTSMQKEIFQSEQSDYESLLSLTEKGLTDQLTSLSTRTVLLNRMPQFLARVDSCCAVFFLDLDNLKTINDTYGHEAGDCALTQFARTLKEYEKQYKGIAARYGGDEFILILDGIDDQLIDEVADTLCKSLRSTINVNGNDIAIHSSIGVALCPQHGHQAEDLICKADLALYTAKQNGKNRYALYQDSVFVV